MSISVPVSLTLSHHEQDVIWAIMGWFLGAAEIFPILLPVLLCAAGICFYCAVSRPHSAKGE